MVYLIFGLTAVGSFFASMVSYSESLKTQSIVLYITLGLLCSLTVSGSWYVLTYMSTNRAQVLIYSMWYDALILGCYILVPVLYGTKLSTNETAGILIIILGIILTKV